MSDYLCDGAPVSHLAFVHRALDPHASAVVDACAGSGKTWLLVGRIVRLLLDGVAPGRILAITFTRRAAQEMRLRLLQDLAVLARADAPAALELLEQRALSPQQARAALPAARGLYERVATADDTVSIDTFHGWFWRMLRCAPLGSGVPHTAMLMEAPQRLLLDAWSDFAAGLLAGGAGDTAALADYEALVSQIGDFNTEKLLHGFLDKRAEWWSFGAPAPAAQIERACGPMRAALQAAGFPVDEHPGAALRGPEFTGVLRRLLACWQQVPAPAAALREAIGRAQEVLQRPARPEADLSSVARLFLTDKAQPRKALEPDDLGRRLPQPQPQYGAWLAQVHAMLRRARAAELEWDALRLNRAGLRCGVRLLHAYESRKRRANAVDFTDIESFAERLLRSEDTAAYMQAYLDSRYRHLLVDEFQDTSTLQWRVLQCWLNAYEGDSERPTVFLVGDPKQSIYRFRRAEPRVFDAARAHLARHLGAAHLRTNVTRRNPPALIAVFDAVFAGCNPLYQPQSSQAEAGDAGHFMLLPLAAALAMPGDATPAPGAPAASSPALPPPLRDVLTQSRAGPDEDPHDREGRQLAQCLAHWVRTLRVPERGVLRPARWGDVIVLVRRRRHLESLERALREAGIPTLSDRRGGLLDRPEIEDCVALLDFLCSQDDRSLAHALRSPVFGCSDPDLLQIAQAPAAGANWWQRLLALPDASPQLARARSLLHHWMDSVGVLPVHDLLDRIFDSADLRARYAACMPAGRVFQVQANLDAFLQLALTLDAGRFPTLTRFLDDVRWVRERDTESIDEGLEAADDTVRLMTIHGAKGLEAPIVAIADAAAGEGPDDHYGVLLDWPPDSAAPEHFSLIGRVQRAGAGRRRWLDTEREQREQEDWNLMYVAMTRARQVLIVSGSERARGGAGAGQPGSWYERLRAVVPPRAHAPDGAEQDADSAAPPAKPRALEVLEFRPEARPTGARRAAGDSDAARLGRLWHALLEHQAAGAPAPDELAAGDGLGPEQARLASQAAQRVLGAPALARFFDPAAPAWSELDVVDASGAGLRIDRLVELDDAVWILDYKWSCNPDQKPQYERQLERYAGAVRALYPGRPVRTALILADATLSETGTGPGTDKIIDGGPPRIEAP